MTPTFFASPADFRKWLLKNHQKETMLVVGFYKTGSGLPSITWPQAVDEALCFGWIDGVRQSIDKDSYQIRFTQRKPTSIWSAVNIAKMETLAKKGLLHPAGEAIFALRKEHKSKIYSYENEAIKLSRPYERLFRANKKAWAYFNALAASYQRNSTNWVMTASQKATQLKRLLELIAASEAGTNPWKDNKYGRK